MDVENSSGTELQILQKFREIFSFPHPVNEYTARAVAAMVVTLSLINIATGMSWLIFVLTLWLHGQGFKGPNTKPSGSTGYKNSHPPITAKQACSWPIQTVRTNNWLGILRFRSGITLHLRVFVRWGLIPSKAYEKCNNLNLGNTL